MEKSKKSINVEGGFLFCGGWNFSKSVSVGSTFIREMSVVLWVLAEYPLLLADGTLHCGMNPAGKVAIS